MSQIFKRIIFCAIVFCAIGSSMHAAFPLKRENFHKYEKYDGINVEGRKYYTTEYFRGFEYNFNGSNGFRFIDTFLKADIFICTDQFNFYNNSGICTASVQMKEKSWKNISFETLCSVDGYQGFIFYFPKSEVELLIMFINEQVFSTWRFFE